MSSWSIRADLSMQQVQPHQCERVYMGWLDRGVMAVLVSMFVWLGWASWGWMILRWHPALWEVNGTWWQRLTAGDSYFNHGALVLTVSVWLMWQQYRARQAVMHQATTSVWTAWLMVGLGGGGLMVGQWTQVHLLGMVGWLMMAVGGLWIWFGGQMVTCWAGALGLLGFMLPLPMEGVSELNYQLKMLSAWGAGGLVGWLTDWPVVVRGCLVEVQSSPIEPGMVLTIEGACSGLRNIMGLTWLGAVLAVCTSGRWYWRCGLLAVAVGLAWVMNLLRIAGMMIIAGRWGATHVAEGTDLHEALGVLAFVLAAGGLFVIARGVAWSSDTNGLMQQVQGRGQRESVKRRVEPAVNQQTGQQVNRGLSWWTKCSALVVLAIMVMMKHSQAEAVADETGSRLNYECRNESGRVIGHLVVVRSGAQVALHPPEICLQASGHELLESRVESWPKELSHVLAKEKLSCPAPTLVRMLRTQRGDGQHWQHWYFIQQGQRNYDGLWSYQLGRLSEAVLRKAEPATLVHLSLRVE